MKKSMIASTSKDEVDQVVIPDFTELEDSEFSAPSSIPSHIVSAVSSTPASPFASEAKKPELNSSEQTGQSHFYGYPNVTSDNLGDVSNVLEEELRRREQVETNTTNCTVTSARASPITMAGVNTNIT